MSTEDMEEILDKLDQNRNNIIDYKELLCNSLNAKDHLTEKNIKLFFSQIRRKIKSDSELCTD